MRNELIELYKLACENPNDKDIVQAYQLAKKHIGPQIAIHEALGKDEIISKYNALCEAVHKAMGRTAACDKKQTNEQLVADIAYLKRLLVEARDEVDRMREKTK